MSVRWRLRISVAIFSSVLAMMASVVTNSADGGQTEVLARELLDARVDVGVRADGAREFADGDDLLGVFEALDVAFDLCTPEEEL